MTIADLIVPPDVILATAVAAALAVVLMFGRVRRRLSTERGMALAVTIVIIALGGNIVLTLIERENRDRIEALENPSPAALDLRLERALKRCGESRGCRRELARLLERAMREEARARRRGRPTSRKRGAAAGRVQASRPGAAVRNATRPAGRLAPRPPSPRESTPSRSPAPAAASPASADSPPPPPRPRPIVDVGLDLPEPLPGVEVEVPRLLDG